MSQELLPCAFVEAEYIDSGTFVGVEEDCYKAGLLERGVEVVLVKKEDLLALLRRRPEGGTSDQAKIGALIPLLTEYKQALKDHAADGCYCYKTRPELKVCLNDCGPAMARRILAALTAPSSKETPTAGKPIPTSSCCDAVMVNPGWCPCCDHSCKERKPAAHATKEGQP